MILSNPELVALMAQNVVRRKDGVYPTVDIISIDLHLSDTFIRYISTIDSILLPSHLPTETIQLDADGCVDFPPGSCLLACTEEFIDMPLSLMGFIQTKGTIARGFVTIHLCDGQIDPGYKGNITLELVNFSSFNYRLKPGVAIAQLFLHKISTPVVSGYKGRYQSATGPTSMRE